MSIGADIPRIDGLSKLTGRAKYVDDLAMPGLLHGATVRSPAPRGRIRAVHFDPAVAWREFTIVDHRDIPGPNVVRLIEADQPALAAAEVRHKHEPILLLAHPSPEMARRAARAVRIEIEPLPAVFDVNLPPTPGQIQHGSDNVFKTIDIRKGDARAALASSPLIIEGEYHTGPQEHVYIEPNGMLAHRENGVMVVRGSMQCPYYVLKGLTCLFDRPEQAFRVVQTTTGGGFGGKEEFPTIVAIHAALLAEKSGRPVKLVYDRQEDMSASTKRHPSRIRHRTGVDRDGRLLAREIDIVMDGGAYVTLSPVVLSRGAIHAGGPYRCDHVHIHAEARLSNAPPYGAFRGFGAPQTIFALERHLDVVAAKLGLPPEELRRRNLLKPGDSTSTGQVYEGGADLAAMQQQALQIAATPDLVQDVVLAPASAQGAVAPASAEGIPASVSVPPRSFDRLRADLRAFNSTQTWLRRGVGMATFMHGAGFTGSGETMLASEAWVEGLPDGRVAVLTANTDMGQGTETILPQVAADALGLGVNDVACPMPDTSLVPNSGPTVASRTAMVVGRLIERACEDLRRQLESDRPASPSDPARQTLAGLPLNAAIRRWHATHPSARLIGRATYVKPDSITWDDHAYRGDAYACFSYATYVVQVEVDLRTYAVRVLDIVAVQEVGRVIHPTLARGQIAGGVAQAIGWALMEDVLLADGAMQNARMTNYLIPTSGDLPPLRVYFVEAPSRFGPGGAKGIGELPMDGPAPAVVNAVCDALGLQTLNVVPLTPERLMAMLPA